MENFDDFFILIESSKFVIYDQNDIKLIPEAKKPLEDLLIKLNKNQLNLFLRYGQFSFLLCFLAMIFFLS